MESCSRSRSSSDRPLERLRDVCFSLHGLNGKHLEAEAEQVALVICDVWNDHWCEEALFRMYDLALRIESFASTARRWGVKIIHAPSGTMPSYITYPEREFVLRLPETKEPPSQQVYAPNLPIDDSDGGCGTAARRVARVRRQNINISILPGDAIADSGQEFLKLRAHWNIQFFLYTGVHTNQCLLDRSFGIKQMRRWGQRCVLVRDLTDCIYNPGSWPFVTHAQGADLILSHIEMYWCPTVRSQLLAAAVTDGRRLHEGYF